MTFNLSTYIILALLLLFISCSKVSYYPITLKQFKSESTTRKVNTLIVDTRSNQDYLEAHLNGAINIPFCDHYIDTLAKYISDKQITKPLLYIYASSKDITLNQISEIKQSIPFYKKPSFKIINYLNDDLVID